MFKSLLLSSYVFRGDKQRSPMDKVPAAPLLGYDPKPSNINGSLSTDFGKLWIKLSRLTVLSDKYNR